MDTTILGFEPGTSARMLIVAAATGLMLAFIIAVARRRQSYWWVSIASIAAGYAGLALASYFAVRIFMGVLANMAISGGGIASVRFGIWQATQPALVAAWAAVLITLLATVFVPWSVRKEPTSPAGMQRSPNAMFALLALLALAVGATPVLLFRQSMAFVLWAIDPRAHSTSIYGTSVPRAIATRLIVTATVSACCFLILTALLVIVVLLARKSNPSRPLLVITLFALVASLGLSVVLAASLHSFSSRNRTAALTGRISPE